MIVVGGTARREDVLIPDAHLPGDIRPGDLLRRPRHRRLPPRHGVQLQPLRQAAGHRRPRRPGPAADPPGDRRGLLPPRRRVNRGLGTGSAYWPGSCRRGQPSGPCAGVRPTRSPRNVMTGSRNWCPTVPGRCRVISHTGKGRDSSGGRPEARPEEQAMPGITVGVDGSSGARQNWRGDERGSGPTYCFRWTVLTVHGSRRRWTGNPIILPPTSLSSTNPSRGGGRRWAEVASRLASRGPLR